MTVEQRRRIATYRAASRMLNKAHTLLMAEPVTKKIAADNVLSALLKLDNIIKRLVKEGKGKGSP